jgi:Na+-translocating ferredoxin:NAD+ oxidoreductase RnfA subunit
MGSSKPQEHGMNACEMFLSLMTSKLVKLILLSLLKPLQKIYLYAKFMLMISYLGLLTNLIVKSLVGS